MSSLEEFEKITKLKYNGDPRLWKAQWARLDPDEWKLFACRVASFGDIGVDRIVDRLNEIMGDWTSEIVVNALQVSMLKYFRPQQQLVEETRDVQPIHGPFTADYYLEERNVMQYVQARAATRIADTEAVLAAIPAGVIVAPGDGIGVTQMAARAFGDKFEVYSSDASPFMVEYGKKMGNDIRVSTIAHEIQEWRGKDVIYFLSHVTDHMSQEQIEELAQEHTVIFGRATEFPGCIRYRPYRRKWGYQLCSANVGLGGIGFISSFRVFGDLDYSMFAQYVYTAQGSINIDSRLPLYLDKAVEMGVDIREDAPYVISPEFLDKADKLTGVPGVGIMSDALVAAMGVVPEMQLATYMNKKTLYRPYYPTVIANKFFCKAQAVYLETEERATRLTPRVVDGLEYYETTARSGVIKIELCNCVDADLEPRPLHSHNLRIVAKKRVEWENLLGDVRLIGQSEQRQSLRTHYCSRSGDSMTSVYNFNYLEVANEIIYDHSDLPQ